ncbi:glycogen-binding subunit 76A [Episyrphus balteatus]|uniref:glycogen-binding subunit 76A n=1 Tax=Episyrphus balteatus TaxID=286459 RepID=UPI002485E1B7|nr:glycogen-binding subunit 76A [Episyrphus balteatus]XP_055843994.1 glycogen-binding subunit 76A [Episyrphus balteatus]
MNGPGDIPLTQSVTPEGPCGLVAVIPTLGMSSCRGRAEAFARTLQSKLRTLGSQNEDNLSQEEEPIINGGPSSNTWVPSTHDSEQTVTNLQPLRHESDSFFDFDCELESPGSPVDECEYLRLIESASNTPHNSATESGYACTSVASSHSSSSDCTFFDPETEYTVPQQIQFQQPRLSSTADNESTIELDNIRESLEISLTNGHGDSENYNGLEKQNNLPKDSSDDSNSLPPEFQDSCCKNESIIEDAIKKQEEILNELQKKSQIISSTPTHNGQSNKITEKIQQNDESNIKISLAEIKNLHGESEITISITEPDESEEPEEETQTKTTDRGKITSVLDTDDEDDCRPQRVRRCSSLKTGKTPPGTPGRKKIVRFADVLGLDLADVKTFLDEIPNIPKSAFEDLEIMESEPPIQLGPKSDKLLMPLFQQPGGLPTFLDLVREKQVSLENAAVSDHINHTINGSVRVRNLDFHKSVHIRYTIDNWRTYADLQGTYVDNSCDGFSDKFTFVLYGNSMQVGQRLEFAVRFQCKGQQFWDNNFGANYCFQCLPSTSQTNLSAASQNSSVGLPDSTPHHNGNEGAILSPAAGETWCGFY